MTIDKIALGKPVAQLIGEIKRRTDTVSCFPNEAAKRLARI